MIQVLSRMFRQDFDDECRNCGTSPCVVVLATPATPEVETELCGPCYFEDAQMLDYWLWNDFDDTYLNTESAPEVDEDD